MVETLNTEPSSGATTADSALELTKAINSLVTSSDTMSDEELVALAQRHKRIAAGLNVVASITGALYAMHQVLTDAKFQELLEKDVPAEARSMITKGINTVLQKLDPLFRAFSKFQQPTLREKTENMFDAAVDIAYAVVELSDAEAREAAEKTADNIALTMGLIKNGGPYILACIELVGCCMAALARDATRSKLQDTTVTLVSELYAKLLERTKRREEAYNDNVAAGMKLLEVQKAKLLLGAGSVSRPAG
jgi:hypothetical protein